MLEKLKLMLNINDNSKDDLLTIILAQAANKVNLAINSTTLPAQLEWVVVEMAIKRFNKLGSEGVASESVDGITKTYEGEATELDAYASYLTSYSSVNPVAKFRFL